MERMGKTNRQQRKVGNHKHFTLKLDVSEAIGGDKIRTKLRDKLHTDGNLKALLSVTSPFLFLTFLVMILA